ncbi:unnamed protein product [Urochloa decumbens]|uniref:BTB domain-containing protein n=1 Tax=Urochloa decumbens TaxID=240449 RepID=A0ABC9EBD1_9POAL
MLPASVSLTYEARCVQMFKIDGSYTATNKEKEKPGATASRVCAVGGHDWRIEFHPKASNPVNFCSGGGDWIMFRVRLISKVSGDGVAASFSCRLVDPIIPSSLPEETKTTIASSMFHENYSRDVFLVRRRELEASRRRNHQRDDCIFVQCVLTVLLDPKDVTPGSATAAPAPAKASVTVPSADLHRDLGELLQSQAGADVTFVVASEPVAAHRCVLAARSPVFMAELFGGMKENASSARVEISDMEVEVFKALLHFVYTDTVPELEQKGEQATVMAQHLLEAADRYGLERLKRICVEKVSEDVSVDTVATTLALAEQHGCSELKSRCMKFILHAPENLQVVAATEGFKHLEASCPSVLTELLMLMAEGTK